MEEGVKLDDELRCLCNKLLFVLDGENIRVRCGRCKRTMVVRTRGILGIRFETDEDVAVGPGA